ncbi:Signal recognition particle, subunit Ffh SRP54 [Fimbriiglobus ruber]|uniref:Signal recognition particle, subunit Ffh SRP54 n=1 Tax=Fimbriiglobus ruber TaxID=1908690 RepID=A0A225DMJ9_9BACT|nr:Signal recognition particle, subunit Ffh SRP54 [Fimbriiglobus ruber]
MIGTVGLFVLSGIAPAVAQQPAAQLKGPRPFDPAVITALARGAAPDYSTTYDARQAGVVVPSPQSTYDPNAAAAQPANGTFGGQPAPVRTAAIVEPSAGKPSFLSNTWDGMKGLFSGRSSAPSQGRTAPAYVDPPAMEYSNAPVSSPGVSASPPAYRWYGWGTTTPGSNPHAPSGQHPRGSANWYAQTGATPGAFPVMAATPARMAAGAEPPAYVGPQPTPEPIVRPLLTRGTAPEPPPAPKPVPAPSSPAPAPTSTLLPAPTSTLLSVPTPTLLSAPTPVTPAAKPEPRPAPNGPMSSRLAEPPPAPASPFVSTFSPPVTQTFDPQPLAVAPAKPSPAATTTPAKPPTLTMTPAAAGQPAATPPTPAAQTPPASPTWNSAKVSGDEALTFTPVASKPTATPVESALTPPAPKPAAKEQVSAPPAPVPATPKATPPALAPWTPSAAVPVTGEQPLSFKPVSLKPPAPPSASVVPPTPSVTPAPAATPSAPAAPRSKPTVELIPGPGATPKIQVIPGRPPAAVPDPVWKSPAAPTSKDTAADNQNLAFAAVTPAIASTATPVTPATPVMPANAIAPVARTEPAAATVVTVAASVPAAAPTSAPVTIAARPPAPDPAPMQVPPLRFNLAAREPAAPVQTSTMAIDALIRNASYGWAIVTDIKRTGTGSMTINLSAGSEADVRTAATEISRLPQLKAFDVSFEAALKAR